MSHFIYGSLLAMLCAFSASAQTVTLDYYFNHEVRKTAGGQMERFHYLWEDKTNPGFSIWGEVFKKNGAKLDTLGEAPTLKNLARSDIYIIVDPDNKKESPNPNLITGGDVKQILAWVKKGGVLVLIGNDSANVNLTLFNTFSDQLGTRFNNDIQCHVVDDNHFEDGAIAPENTVIFKSAKKIFLKDVCSISYTGKQTRPVLKAKNGAVVATVTKYGKGIVFSIGDPWLYNEYVNGRLPAGFDNDKAANNLTIWLLKQIPRKK